MKNKKQEVEQKVPTDLHKELATSEKSMALWQNLTPIARRDFISWIEGAKQPETRARRIKITYEKLLAGKRHPCCYAIVPMDVYKELSKNKKAKGIWKHLTPNERRDLVEKINTVKEPQARALEIQKICTSLE